MLLEKFHFSNMNLVVGADLFSRDGENLLGLEKSLSRMGTRHSVEWHKEGKV